MKNSLNFSVIEFDLNSSNLKKLYNKLMVEDIFFEMNVKKVKSGTRHIVFKCNPNMQDYFRNEINSVREEN